MKFRVIIFLTLIWAIVSSLHIYALSFSDQSNQNYYRWNIETSKDRVSLIHEQQKLSLRAQTKSDRDALYNQINSNKINSKYIDRVELSDANERDINVFLKDSSTNAFSFYRDVENKLIIDFWRETADGQESLNPKKVSQAKTDQSRQNKGARQGAKKLTPEITKKSPRSKVSSQNKNRKGSSTQVVSHKAKSESPERDYRYGLPHFWNYQGILPEFKKPINISRKTPEFFYKIKDVDIEKNERNAHIQLAINLYRKKKYGLMNKSLELYYKKYGDNTSEQSKLEYLKANAFLREGLNRGKSEPSKIAINLLKNLFVKGDIYEQRKAIGKYLISYYFHKKDYIQMLSTARNLYLLSKNDFDYEELNSNVDLILYSLAQLKQTNEIKEILNDKFTSKFMSPQRYLAYQSYAMLMQGRTNDLVRLYEKEKKNLAKPIEGSFLYNVAEAYFRLAKLKEATSLFDQFIEASPFNSEVGKARLRIALSYEIQGASLAKTRILYRSVINTSKNNEAVTEARLRLVANGFIRNNHRGPKERDLLYLLNFEDKSLFKEHKKLKWSLWLSRMRSFIVMEDYSKAFKYLNSLPLNTIDPIFKKSFEQDGAEIVYGLVVKSYQDGDSSQVVNLWNSHKENFLQNDYVSKDLFFMVAQSYSALNLYKSLDQIMVKMDGLAQHDKDGREDNERFPLWVKRTKLPQTKMLIRELKVSKNIELGNWKRASQLIADGIKLKENDRLYYYRALVYNKFEKNEKSLADVEKFITSKQVGSLPQNQAAKVLELYTDLLFKTNKVEKFQRVVESIISNKSKQSRYMEKLKERLYFLHLEILSKDEKNIGATNEELLEKIADFKKHYPQSSYLSRVNYVEARSLINKRQVAKGKKILEELLENDKTESYIKDLARSELSDLLIKEKTL